MKGIINTSAVFLTLQLIFGVLQLSLCTPYKEVDLGKAGLKTEVSYVTVVETGRNTDFEQLQARQKALEVEVATLKTELQELKALVGRQQGDSIPEKHNIVRRCKCFNLTSNFT